VKRALFVLFAAATLQAQPTDLERSVAMMARVGSASTPRYSHDSTRIAFLTSLSGSPQVWIISAAGGYPQQVTAFDDPVSGLEWSPDGQWLAVEVAPGGGLNSQIYVLRPDGTGVRRLTDGGKENNRLGLWTPDSKTIVMSSNRQRPASMDIWAIDAATGAIRLVAQTSGVASVLDSGNTHVLISRLKSRGDNDIYRIRLEDGREVHLTPHTPPATFSNARFGHTSDTVYLIGNANRDRAAFGRVRVVDWMAEPFEVLASRDDAELDSFEINPMKSVAVLSWNMAGKSEISGLSLEDMKEHPGPVLPSDLAGGFEFARSSREMALSISGSNAPPDIWIMDMGTRKLRQLTFSPHPGVDLSSMVRPELVSYKAHDGLPLSGWLYRPAGLSPPYPMVFSFHGGPEGQERPVFNSTYQALVANGIAVFAPNVRGSSGFGKRFINLDNGPLRREGVRDIQSSTDHMVRAGLADPKRLGIMGGSYGGYMVMAGVTEFPDLFAAGVNLFGVVNFETFFKHSEPWMAAISTVEYGDPATQGDMLRALSPIHKIGRVKTPLLVLHGANDTNVPVIEAEQIVDTMKKRNVPVEYILFPDEGHGWRKTPNRIRSTVAIVKFFKERLVSSP
jgi:dipeptidyl aminopeptidase/acylaminoacyl peptidase